MVITQPDMEAMVLRNKNPVGFALFISIHIKKPPGAIATRWDKGSEKKQERHREDQDTTAGTFQLRRVVAGRASVCCWR